MRRISFALTKDQVRLRTKRVTRRIGWTNLKTQERLAPVEKCRGLKRGERQVVIEPVDAAPVIECVSNRLERLGSITKEDVILEGFPEMTQEEFVEMFCRTHKRHDGQQVTADDLVSRIAFRYVGVGCMCHYLAPEQRDQGQVCNACYRVNTVPAPRHAAAAESRPNA